jgi:hypothetical protein
MIVSEVWVGLESPLQSKDEAPSGSAQLALSRHSIRVQSKRCD